MLKIYSLFFILCLCGCGIDASNELKLNEISLEESDNRVTITRIGIFRDSLAYGNKRGVYLIVDNHSRKEYIGISGIGISEVGEHTNSNDDKVSDER